MFKIGDVKAAGAEVLAPLGGAVGLGLSFLDKLVSADLVPWHTGLATGVALGLYAAITNLRRQMERARQKYLPRLQALKIHHVPFTIAKQPSGTVVGVADSFNVWWINDPEESHPDASAKGIRSFIEVRCNGELVHTMVGRWDETAQPEPAKPTAHLAQIDLGIGEWRTMALFVRFRNDPDTCTYLFNNDSYQYPNLKKPEFRLAEPEYDVSIRIRGDNVDARSWVHLKQSFDANHPVVRLTAIEPRPIV